MPIMLTVRMGAYDRVYGRAYWDGEKVVFEAYPGAIDPDRDRETMVWMLREAVQAAPGADVGQDALQAATEKYRGIVWAVSEFVETQE